MRIDINELCADKVGTQVDVEVNLGAHRLSDDVEVTGLIGTLHLWRTTEGVWVRGCLTVGTDLQCVRCLAPMAGELEIELDERFQFPPIPQDAEGVRPIDGDHTIDLGPALRELVIVSTPIRALCRPDCAGICSNCGKELNEGPCDCQTDEIDPRMAALKALLS